MLITSDKKHEQTVDVKSNIDNKLRYFLISIEKYTIIFFKRCYNSHHPSYVYTPLSSKVLKKNLNFNKNFG